MQLAVASHYAKALGELVTRPDSAVAPRDAVAQVKAFEGLVAGSQELKAVLLSPAVSNGRKREIIAKLAGRMGVSPLVRNFLNVVLDHRRVAILGDIRVAFEAQVDELLGEVRAEVKSARELTAAQKAKLELELADLTGKKVRMEYGVDDELIGGVTARVGSTIYDGSVRGRLDAMRRRLTAE